VPPAIKNKRLTLKRASAIFVATERQDGRNGVILVPIPSGAMLCSDETYGSLQDNSGYKLSTLMFCVREQNIMCRFSRDWLRMP